ncbi:putative peptidase [Nymphon striatum]|nr:putative peptidase [Nymphon striatum]
MDDGITLLADALLETVGQAGTVGVPSAIEAYLRMPLADFAKLKTLLPTVQFGSDNTVMARLRAIKSDQEVAKIRQACAIAGRAFDRVPEIAGAGIPLERVFRDFQRLLLEEGADWVPYLAGGAGPDGYDDVISPASEAPLVAGDVLMLDTGAVFDGYFCDYDRNYVVGRTHPDQQSAWDVLQEATAAGREACRVGNTASDVFHAMDRIVTGGAGGSDAGRLGHGLGMQLTEGLSFMAADHTVLEAGMVITLEPGVMMPGGGMMVHEDDFVVRDEGAEATVTERASRIDEGVK